MSRTNEIDQLVSKNLRAIRKARGVSMTDLADVLGVSYQQVQKYEKSQNRVSASVLLKVATLLGVKVEDFYAGVDQYEPDYLGEKGDIKLTLEHRRLVEAYSKIDDKESKNVILALLATLNA